jgi:hypothetical protein
MLKAIQRHGWTLSQWKTLSPPEQEVWLALELRRERDLEELIERFQEKHRSESGHEYSAWEPAAAAQLLAARVE